MPQKNLDRSIVEAARISYDAASTTHTSSDRGLIRYLLRHSHTTPFEMVEFKFAIKMPIFIARQHLRHRTASVNEVSARYSEIKDEFFVPEELRKQAKVNRQGSEGSIEYGTDKTGAFKCHNDMSHSFYKELMDEWGVCREQARMVLPQSMYTEFIWKIDLHNLLHYLRLRMGQDAQAEIRAYANKIYELVKPLAPMTLEAFEDFRLNAVTFTGPEMECLRAGGGNWDDVDTSTLSKGEERELREKIRQYIKGCPPTP